VRKLKYEILKNSLNGYNLPIMLESSVDEMGVMVGFDGGVEQIDQLVNFSYTQSGNNVTIYGTTNPDKLRSLIGLSFNVYWGDKTTGVLNVNDGIVNTNLPSITHTYLENSKYIITVKLETPWTTNVVNKIITVPSNITINNPLGTFTGLTIPSYSNLTGQTQNYLNNLDYTNNTGNTSFSYIAIGKSRISEKKLYGSNNYNGVITGTDSLGVFSGYTIDNLRFMDYPNGYTMITGTTVGTSKEEVFNRLITRNEHFLGFIDEPTIYSDIFIERGKQNVMEKNLRLCEIDNVGEIDLYQNGFFSVKKQ
jgi:hypothetical protein